MLIIGLIDAFLLPVIFVNLVELEANLAARRGGMWSRRRPTGCETVVKLVSQHTQFNENMFL